MTEAIEQQLSNNPPIHEQIAMKVDDFYHEAGNWLDGEPIQNQEQADCVGVLASTLRDLKNEADKHRKIEKKPYDDAGKAVQEKYKPIIEKADRGIDTLKKALAKFLAAQETERRRKAEEAQREAQRKAEEARKIAEQADSTNLTDVEAREAAIKEAKQAEAAAKKIDNQRGSVAGTGRAMSVRTYYEPQLISELDAMMYFSERNPKGLADALTALAKQEINAGLRKIPGFEVIERKTVV